MSDAVLEILSQTTYTFFPYIMIGKSLFRRFFVLFCFISHRCTLYLQLLKMYPTGVCSYFVTVLPYCIDLRDLQVYSACKDAQPLEW